MQDLTRSVELIMTKELVTVVPTESAAEVMQLMVQKETRCALVCDADKQLKGIVTDSDLVFGVAGQGEQNLRTPISEIMTKDPVTVDAGVPIYDVVAIMSHHGFRRVPVVKDGRVVGIVSTRDIICNLADNLETASRK